MKILPTSSHLIPGLIFLLAIVMSGCKTAEADQANKSNNTSVQEAENPSEKSVVAESEEHTCKTEEQTAKNKKKKKNKNKDMVQEPNGPGDGPTPTKQAKNKLEEMEDSLAPIKAIPAVPKA